MEMQLFKIPNCERLHGENQRAAVKEVPEAGISKAG